jgi:hypothetical protein
MHRFDCAQAMEVGVGVGNDLGRKRIEERLPFGGPWQRWFKAHLAVGRKYRRASIARCPV